uniref:Uncharacterized protein n=1 Tax=Periophthalmus magnuspinnatus TaxID=409849 RepID=A0A3B3Z8C1_9GOBI
PVFSPPAAMNGGASIWAITPEERGKHDKQFESLAPVLGFVSGEQARKFFLQSGLPPSVLAEIWNLADMDSDGKMDRLEFSIAMKLIKLKLQGRNPPTSLPMIMKQTPVSNAGANIPSSARFGMGSMPNLSIGLPPMPSMSAMPILTPIPANPSMPTLQPLIPAPMTLPLLPMGAPGLTNGNLLTPPALSNTTGWFCCGTGVNVTVFCLFSSNSSSTTSLTSNSPKTGVSDWAVPQASRLKYRQQFNTLDKLMSGYLSGPQVRNALMASNLTQTQLATIWTLADVDKDGQLRADEFILAMHLVDMAKTGRPLPLTLPQDLIPPSLSAELEKRRLALEEQQKKERERREREEREALERREREAREMENRRRLEEERRMERQREIERQREEERLREMERKEAAKQELERQRKEEWERGRKEELSRRREGEQDEISRLKARKKSLELELEAGNKHKQISDRLRDAQSKRRIQKAEVDLINQKRDARIAEINTLQIQFENSFIQVCFFFLFLRLAKLEQERLEQERREQERREQERREQERLEQERRQKEEEEARQRRLLEEQRARQREEEEREAQARLRAAQEKAKEEERKRREEEQRQRREEEERKRREEEQKQRREEEERRRREEEQRRLKEEEEERKRKEEQERLQRASLVSQQPSKLTTYRALYSFVARNADELSVDADCLIEVDEQTVGEPGWLCGSYRGNRGWFPQSYAQKCGPHEASTDTGPSSPLRRPSFVYIRSNNYTTKCIFQYQIPSPLLARALSSWSPTSDLDLHFSGGDVITALLSFSQGDIISVLQQRDDWWLGQLNGTQGWFPKGYVMLEAASKYVALYTYESPEVGDLTFVEGDVVMVTEREGEWWRGCVGDQMGVFPSNYVRPVEPEVRESLYQHSILAVTASVSPMMHQLCLSPGQLIVVLAKNSTGWWLGELQARGKKRQRGWFHSSHVKLLGPSSSKTSPLPLPVCQVIAMYDYAAANPDELSFSKGQLISVLDKTNPDWWKGEANGVIGLLPTNYIKMTTESDPSQQCKSFYIFSPHFFST